MNDQELAGGLAEGDPEAFAEYQRTLRPKLLRRLKWRAHGSIRAQAEDAFPDFETTKLFERAGSTLAAVREGRSPLEPFLMRAVDNFVIDLARKRRRTPESTDLDPSRHVARGESNPTSLEEACRQILTVLRTHAQVLGPPQCGTALLDARVLAGNILQASDERAPSVRAADLLPWTVAEATLSVRGGPTLIEAWTRLVVELDGGVHLEDVHTAHAWGCSVSALQKRRQRALDLLERHAPDAVDQIPLWRRDA